MVLDETLAVTSAVPSVKPVLQLKGVGKTYRRGDEQVNVLVDFDFTLDAGEFVVVTGPSGAGKSTLLHVAGGLDTPGHRDCLRGRPGRMDDEAREHAPRSGGATSDSCSSSSTWCRC